MEKIYRLGKVAIECNVGLWELLTPLQKMGYYFDKISPATKLTSEQYEILKAHFADDIEFKEEMSKVKFRYAKDYEIVSFADENTNFDDDRSSFIRRGNGILITDQPDISENISIIISHYYNYKELAEFLFNNFNEVKNIQLIFDLEAKVQEDIVSEEILENYDINYPLLNTVTYLINELHYLNTITCVGIKSEKKINNEILNDSNVEYIKFPIKKYYIDQNNEFSEGRDIYERHKEFENALHNYQNIRYNKEFAFISDCNFFEDRNDFHFYQIEDKFDINKMADYIYKNYKSSKLIINIESIYRSHYRSNHILVDLIILLRCKCNYLNPIICVGFEPLTSILNRRPEDIILCSPGIKYQQLPCLEFDFKRVSVCRDTNVLRIFLNSKIDMILSTTRHRYANFAGMGLMMYVLKQIWTSVTKDEHVFEGGGSSYPDYYNFKVSTDYFILKYYFKISSIRIPENYVESYKININNKKILLIDDFADQGWLTILSQMIYGNNISENINSLPVELFSEEELLKKIKEFKPHLILLDLRLNDESGEMKLDALKGFQLLKFIKKNTLLKGIPVIMFTATSNAENVKALINSGAEYVWTKPGFDENLLNTDISRRYKLLLNSIENAIKKYSDEQFSNLNNFYADNRKESNFDLLRIELLERNQYLASRIGLNLPKLLDNYFEKFTDIFIDTNIFMSGEIREHSDKDFARTIRNIFTLTNISTWSDYLLKINNREVIIKLPKIIILNSVLDELIKFSKIDNPDQEKRWRRALLAYDIIRGLFEKKLCRTEINAYDLNNKPVCILKSPGYVYADNDIINNISLLHENVIHKIGKYEKIKNDKNDKYYYGINKDKESEIEYHIAKNCTLLITDDVKFIDKIKSVFTEQQLSVLRIEEFNSIIENIEL